MFAKYLLDVRCLLSYLWLERYDLIGLWCMIQDCQLLGCKTTKGDGLWALTKKKDYEGDCYWHFPHCYLNLHVGIIYFDKNTRHHGNMFPKYTKKGFLLYIGICIYNRNLFSLCTSTLLHNKKKFLLCIYMVHIQNVNLFPLFRRAEIHNGFFCCVIGETFNCVV